MTCVYIMSICFKNQPVEYLRRARGHRPLGHPWAPQHGDPALYIAYSIGYVGPTSKNILGCFIYLHPVNECNICLSAFFFLTQCQMYYRETK